MEKNQRIVTRKLFLVIYILMTAVFIAAVYGIIHDQITYSISPEYYTKFKFIQFGLADSFQRTSFPRLLVCQVGCLATWWMGVPIGFVIGLIGLVHRDPQRMSSVSRKALGVVVAVAFVSGLIGLGYGFIFLSDLPRHEFQNWYIPEGVVDFKSYIAVGSMHNFSYAGGVIGLITGSVYTIWQRFVK